MGIDFHKITDLEIEISKLHALKNPEKRLIAARDLSRKYPKHPGPHFELAGCLHELNDPQKFEQLNLYGEVRREWLIQTGLEKLNIDFIWAGMVSGSLGNHLAIEGLLKANQYGLRPARKPFLLLSQNTQLRNPALFSYFEPHLITVRDVEVVNALKGLEFLLTLPLGICLPLNDGCQFMEFAANKNEMEREILGMETALLSINQNHHEMGMQALKKMGLPKDAWYVTLHVREPGYRGETLENTRGNFRNANPLDYLKAINVITSAGGWVFRMGDSSMTPLPQMSRVIDYAHHEIRSDWMDVFLGASCLFCIGTSSGYFTIPRFFGVPVIFTNCATSVEYYMFKEYDLYLPRLLKHKNSEQHLSFEEMWSPSYSMFSSDKFLQDAGLEHVENTPEELEAVTQEMLDKTNKIENNNLQKRFKVIGESSALKHGGLSLKAFTPISQNFLAQHTNLL